MAALVALNIKLKANQILIDIQSVSGTDSIESTEFGQNKNKHDYALGCEAFLEVKIGQDRPRWAKIGKDRS